jgi:hypothetical protein
MASRSKRKPKPNNPYAGAGVANGFFDEKIALRREVSERIPGASVLEAFCGDGELTREWQKLGCKTEGIDLKPWQSGDGPRLVADTMAALSAIDVSRFRVFDIDAWGEPWPEALTIMSRCEFVPGERYGIVITDGAEINNRFGRRSRAVNALLGSSGPIGHGSHSATLACFRRLLQMSGATVEWSRMLEGRRAGSGFKMIYAAAVFTVRGTGNLRTIWPSSSIPISVR